VSEAADLELLLEAMALKHLLRAGWVRAGVPAPESVAAHAWGVGLLALTLAPPELDRGRALAFALIHDLAEVRVGDITPHDGVPADEKRRRERIAAEGLLAHHPALLALWEAYEAQACPESRFVRQLDRLDMALQAALYAADPGIDPAPFHRSAARALLDPRLQALADAAAQPGGQPRGRPPST
jgi:putative hydrolase of HD superfamily